MNGTSSELIKPEGNHGPLAPPRIVMVPGQAKIQHCRGLIRAGPVQSGPVQYHTPDEIILGLPHPDGTGGAVKHTTRNLRYFVTTGTLSRFRVTSLYILDIDHSFFT